LCPLSTYLFGERKTLKRGAQPPEEGRGREEGKKKDGEGEKR